jgi:predicted  nucleic acid-binding Zn-ribbon protein
MLPPVLAKLLILQARDKQRRDLEGQLQAIPHEVAGVEAKIAAEKGALDAARAELMAEETKKKLLESEIGEAQQKAGRYRSQQLEVRKNDEYRALGAEIETMQTEIGRLEEQELVVMYAIDETKKKLAAADAEMKSNISGHEGRIRLLREREVTLRTELVAAKAACEEARVGVDEPARRLYDRISGYHFPACVPIHDAKCGGCHLKISSEVESAARGKGGELALCDQCGRIVWWEM